MGDMESKNVTGAGEAQFAPDDSMDRQPKASALSHERILSLVLIALMAAVLSILSILQIPMPSGVPITLQTFAVALCGYVLGRRGVLSTGLYILLGAVSLPVFSGMRGGMGVLVGLTGGFIVGFIPLACCCGLRFEKKWISLITGMVGLLCCYLIGALVFMLHTGRGYGESFALVCLPYTVKDMLSVAGAFLVSLPLRRALVSAGLYHD